MTKIWRVQLAYGEGTKLHVYERGSKTYFSYTHAKRAYAYWKQRDFEVSLLEAEVSDWNDISPE